MSRPSVSDLVAAGVYVHSAHDGSSLEPRLGGLLVRYALLDEDTFGDNEQRTIIAQFNTLPDLAPAKFSHATLKALLNRLLTIEPDFSSYDVGGPENSNKHGSAFKQFHCLLELIKQYARLICWPRMGRLARIVDGTYVSASLAEHYQIENPEQEITPSA